MIDPLSPLFEFQRGPAGDFLPHAAGPATSHWLVGVGVAMIFGTTVWSFNKLVAKGLTTVLRLHERLDHWDLWDADSPSRR